MLIAVAVLPFVAALPASAAIRPGDRDKVGRPSLVAPAQGQLLVESAARFAYELPPGFSRPVLVVSRQAFDPSGWTAIPKDAGFVVKADAHTLKDAGLALDSDATLWWTVIAREDGTDRLVAAPVRSFEAQRKFRNAIQASPYLSPARVGRMDAADMSREGVRVTAAPHIRLSAGYDFAPAQGEPAVPGDMARATSPVDETSSDGIQTYIVQFKSMPDAERVAAITRAGGAVYSYVPDQAYLVRMSPSARTRLASDAGVAWVGEYKPAYRLSALADRSAPGEVDYMALVFPDGDLTATMAAIRSSGGVVTGQSDNGINKLVRFRASGDLLPAVTGLSSVAWVEPVPRNELYNNQAQWVTQTGASNNRRVWTMGLRGYGQVVMTSDSGIWTTHDQFRDPAVSITGFGDYVNHRKIIAYQRGSDNPQVAFSDTAGWHGTHTAGTICGNDSINGTSLNDGMAKDAKMYFMDISGPALGATVDTYADLNDLFLPPYLGNSAGAARISSNSWGSAVNGAYTLNSFEVDQFMWNHKDFFIAFSNGNSGPGLGTTGSPASAKNCASIGGTQNGTLPGIYSGSSRGPTLDSRRKPTFAAPGQGVISSVSNSVFANNTYASFTGTSMASPCAAGTITLMRQYLVDGWYPTGAAVLGNGFNPSAALLKAMAMNSGNGLNTLAAPDNNVGWGKINADSVLYFAGDARKLLLVDNTDGLDAGQFIEYQIDVSDPQPLEVSLVWTDYPGNPAVTNQLVNNLNLRVVNGANTYLGNVYSAGPAPNSSSVTGGTADVANVEEGCRVLNPTLGITTIRVSAPTMPIGPQPFALVITGGVSNGSGLLALDRAEYGSGATVELQVTDLNAGATVDVNVVSNTENGTPESVTLTAAGSGVYNGTLLLTPAQSGPDDGLLSVTSGDQITATYSDASPVLNLVANATVNFDTPTITNVQASNAGVGMARVTWTTDRNSNSTVFYGATPALELGSVSNADALISHSMTLTGLNAGTTYYYDVQSVSLSGGLARDNLGGAHYKYTQKPQGDVLLLYGLPNFENEFAWNDALSSKGYEYDVWSGAISNTARLGDLTTGLRSYKAVLWQSGLEQYPAFSDAQRDTITQYLAGGGRLAVVGHDIGWGLADPTSPSYTAARAAWLQSTLKTQFQADPTTWSSNVGYAGDPISGGYTGGAIYSPFRAGAAGDEINVLPGTGTASYTWFNNEGTPDDIGFRWESGTNDGSPTTAFWGGAPSRLVTMYFEITQMDASPTLPSALRSDIIDKTIVWLFGRDRPTVAITSPNGGENITSSPVSITWNETVGSGRTIVSRSLDYSLDGGSSWASIATGVGASPYSWDVSAVPNSGAARVRIRIDDDGTPGLGAGDQSNANFALNRTGGDTQGPVVVAGSMESAPNPIVRPNPATLTATVSDQLTGAGTVAAAEWSFGAAPAAAGAGNAMTGPFGTTTVAVSGALNTTPFLIGAQKLWVRAQDSGGTWGPASALSLQINGPPPVGVGDPVPAIAFLSQNAPNPFGNSTLIRYGVPSRSRVQLGVYDVTGRLVRQLVSAEVGAGAYNMSWDRRDQSGARVGPGIYYYRLLLGGQRLDRRMVVLD